MDSCPPRQLDGCEPYPCQLFESSRCQLIEVGKKILRTTWSVSHNVPKGVI